VIRIIHRSVSLFIQQLAACLADLGRLDEEAKAWVGANNFSKTIALRKFVTVLSITDRQKRSAAREAPSGRKKDGEKNLIWNRS
jgi:hypothetical protein